MPKNLNTMPEIKNLWSADLLSGEEMIFPITILQEQARYLEEMTKNILVAKIKTYTITKKKQAKLSIIHAFNIFVPAMNNYDFELLRLEQEELTSYPLVVFASLTEESYKVNNSNDLEKALAIVFNGQKTVSVIQSLIQQSKKVQ